jgi:putative heme-binding domain-containing protein
MWSDYATTERLLGIPGEEKITTAGGRETIAGRMWQFPSNTVFARTLTLEMERGKPSTQRHIETQLLHFEGQTWNAYTYRWNAAQTDAELVPAQGASETISVADPAAPGRRREIQWRYHSRAECLRCHNVWAGETLSFNWFQLNTRSDKTELKRLEDMGVLKVKNAPNPLPKLTDPYDVSHPLGPRARSWLHVNCSTCHRNGAGGDVPSWFNYDQVIEKTRALDAKPVRGDFGIGAARVIAPSDPFRSTLFYRISTEASARMPHIGSRIADERGIALIRDWIASLPAPPNGGPDLAAASKLAEKSKALLAQCRNGDRKEAMTNLLGNMSGALALLDRACESGENSFRADAAAIASSHTNTMVRDLFQRLLPPEQRRHTLGPEFNPQTVLILSGDARSGEQIFAGIAQCSRCHMRKGLGRAFGPDLTGIGRKYTPPQLLEQILQPSKQILPEFKTTIVTLTDGRELSGFVIKRDATELVLREENLTEHRLKLRDLKESRESVLSAMPEGLLAPLTTQEAADLLKYLATD